MTDSGIECGIHYYPNHYLEYYGDGGMRLPVTEEIYNELLSLPLHPDLTRKDQDYIVRKIKSFFA